MSDILAIKVAMKQVKWNMINENTMTHDNKLTLLFFSRDVTNRIIIE